MGAKKMKIKILLLSLLVLNFALFSCDSDGEGSADSAQNDVGFVDLGQIEFNLENAFPEFSFQRPIDIQNAGDDSGRIFVAEHRGVIHVLFNSKASTLTQEINSKEIFLDIQERVFFDEGEQGLLGFAFHPDFENNGYLFVNYIADPPLRNVISRFTVEPNDPNRADPNSELIFLEIPQPHPFHNGGQLAFGPDGFLYISVGDGGPAGGAGGRAQDLTNIYGAILRIDVDNPENGNNYGIPTDNPFFGDDSGFREEIFAYGLRNPFRFSFDPETGQIWAGDVGEFTFEEIDIIEKGKNYGWNIMEGTSCFDPPSNCDMTGLELPIFEYRWSIDDRTVIGGFVYRGTNISELVGTYVYGDFVSSRIWALQFDGLEKPVNTELIDFEDFCIVSFGIDEDNELYIACFDGNIYRLVTNTITP